MLLGATRIARCIRAGFILVAIQGNSPYFPAYKGATAIPYLYLLASLFVA